MDINHRPEAEQRHLEAIYRLKKLQALLIVYHGVRNAEIQQLGRDGIEFVDAALQPFPDHVQYLNTKALLLAEGLGDKKSALVLMSRAADLAPTDILIRQNLRSLSTTPKGCLGIGLLGFLLPLGYGAARFFLI